MSIRVALSHRTRYRYDRLVNLGPQVIRLRPAPHSKTRVTSYSLKVSPGGHFLNWHQDPHGNYLARAVFTEMTRELSLDVDLIAELAATNPFDFFLETQAEHVPFEYDPGLRSELAPFLETITRGPRLDELVNKLRPSGEETNDFIVKLNREVHERVKYVIRLEPGVQAPEETLELGQGSCRDSAWLVVQLLRQLGFAARFASGYLIQLAPDQKPLEGPPGPERDFTDLHAWAEVYLPGAGWVGLDATSGLLTAEGHIPLACTPDPSSAAPLSGLIDECDSTLEHRMSVTRIYETPRVTSPYSDEAWEALDDLGAKVDRDLFQNDVRLTMGGEPTFVSIDDMSAHEWTWGALGQDKRRRAGVLFERLARRFAHGPVLHYGQGKWYPGEDLPRWALTMWFRHDDEPIWNDPARTARDDTSYPFTSEDAGRFLAAVARRLGVDESHAIAGYEDAFWYLLRERRLPVNVDVFDNRLEDEAERARVARVFEQGLDAVVGFALPIRPLGNGRWQSGPWFLRRERLYLIPGDSPMGYRLPLESLPWVLEGDYPYVIEPDPFAPRGALPKRSAFDQRRGQLPMESGALRPAVAPGRFQSSADTVRTALCAEVRNQILHVFLPPVSDVEDYLDLVAAIEQTAEELDLVVRIEGYPPPGDPRLVKLSVTPDPGVIEVNIHPCASWNALCDVTTALYEEARLSRLGTERFMLDGGHAGTGGGNHVTLGGPSVGDSPFLRRPDLLASLVGYFHDHPSLSYLFSGQFIGPTSQAPRVDEARYEATHELEIALGIARNLQGAETRPWLTDRVFRHLLADVTGNTHRTEFCVDKLYSPDGPTGRLGLVELRAFEMPPHARMSLAQMLLVRAMIAAFWQRPYRARLPRWGTSLHDRFLLPHFVAQDFRDVLTDLDERGYEFDPRWFDTHFEFRFPLIGSIAHQGVELELRRALEPWNVLPEEQSSLGGAARAVDSSLDRVQVKLSGAVADRHWVSVNGVLAPLHPTGTQGEFVAGVRYRAWALPSSLHPTLPVNVPMVFSLLDTWTERALGGCTLRASHGGGRAYDLFPVNAAEAESRRSDLFSPLGHEHGKIDLSRLRRSQNPDYPLTLDLRRA